MWNKDLIVFLIHLALHEVCKIFHIFVEIVIIVKLAWLFILDFIKFLLLHFDFLFQSLALSVLQMLFLFLLKKLCKHVFCCVLCWPLSSLKNHFLFTIIFIIFIIPEFFIYIILILIIILIFIQTPFIQSLLLLYLINFKEFSLKFAHWYFLGMKIVLNCLPSLP